MEKHGLKSLILALTAALLLVVSPLDVRQVHAEAVKGIDVSVYQGNINWGAVAGSGVKFAMIRLGNTAYGLDKNFAQNVIGANAAGIRTGVYVYTYAKTPEEAMNEAAFTIAALSQFPISFPVAIDFEDTSLRSLTPAQQAEIVNVFCSMVYSAGYTPMVYSNRNWFVERMGYVAWDHWVAQYADRCDYPGAYTMWQASDRGKIAGISGNVDIDYVFRDYFSEIIANGLLTRNGETYLFRNYLRQVGMQEVNGVTYFFGADGRMVRDMTTADAAGNIIRMCRDGHVVIITAEAQAAAANARLLADQAAAIAAQAEGTAALYLQTVQAYNDQYAAAMAQAELIAQTAQAAAEQALAAPTDENLQLAAFAQAQAEEAALAAGAVGAQMTQATADAAAAQQAAAQARTDADAAELTAQAAAQLIVIPE